MGYEYSMNVFILGNLTKDNIGIIRKLFKENGDKSYTKFEPRDFDFNIIFSYNNPLKNYKFYWIGHLFKQGISKQLIQNIGKGIQIMHKKYNDEKSKNIDIRRNNVILCFLKENENSSIIEDPIKEMNVQNTLVEVNNPIIITVGGNNVDDDYEKLKFINKLPGGNINDIIRNIHSKLLTIDAYLNERGNIFDGITYRNLGNFNKLTATTCLDMLIFGGSRSGKSTFVNKLSNSLLAREQNNAETCTTKCTEYIIPLENMDNHHGEINHDNIENQALQQIRQSTGKLKIIDTPGLFEDQDVSKVCECLENYISEEIEIIQLALFFMKDTTTLNKSKEVLKILIKYNIPVFFIQTYSTDERMRIEDTNFYKNIKSFLSNNFEENEVQLLQIYNGNNEIYNFIRINQKRDNEHELIFGIDTLIEKILHFFHYEKINELIKNNLKAEQNFFQQKNILVSCLSDLKINYKNCSLHDALFRKFLTLADVSNYFYAKSIGLVVVADFACASSCIIPIPFADLPLYYSIHIGLILSILSVFGIKIEEVNIKTIMKTNGTSLGGNYANEWTINQIINTGIKFFLNVGKLASDAASLIPIIGIIGKGVDVSFSVIDTLALGKNLITTCNKLPKNQLFFMNELKKFNYILQKLDEIRIRIKNEKNN